MHDRLAKELRRQRSRARLTLASLAQRAGISVSTLRRWESGTTLPRGIELSRVLDVFQATPEERAHVACLLPEPRARSILFLDSGHDLAAEPSPGDLLRAMRCRANYAGKLLAEELLVHPSRVSRWERAKEAPSPEMLARIFHVLHVTTEERELLESRAFVFAAPSEAAPMSLEQCEQAVAGMVAAVEAHRPEPLDLSFLVLQARLLRLPRTPVVEDLLFDAYKWHSEWLFRRGRYAEAHRSAAYAYEIHNWKLIGLYAQSAVYRTERPNPKAGIAILESWIPERSCDPGMYRDLAAFYAATGRVDIALQLADIATNLAEEADSQDHLLLCNFVRARFLRDAGRPDEARQILENGCVWPGAYHTAWSILNWAELWSSLGCRAEAASWMHYYHALPDKDEIARFAARAASVIQLL